MIKEKEMAEELKEKGYYLIENDGNIESIVFSMNFISISNAKERLHNSTDPKEIQIKNMIKFLLK